MNVPHSIETLLQTQPLVKKIISRIHEHKGRALLVGGAVRDLILGLPTKDLDIEIHGISLPDLETILQEFGPVSLVGKAFGVLRLHNLAIDWSIPRTDSTGRKPHVTLDPHLTFEQAFKRRDLTMNAMGIDLITYKLIDPFNGARDIQEKILRTPDPTFFIEDPLRFFRVMHFIGRFAMQPDAELQHICTTMDLKGISRERIEEEFTKLFLKSEQPARGIRWLNTIGRLHEILPELAATKNIAQNPEWHPEGDVFEHSMQALDAAARIPCATQQEKLILMYAALCHDLGKVSTTKEIDGIWRSHGHDVEGVPLATSLLKRITHNADLIKTVQVLVRHHMAPLHFTQEGAKASAYKRLAHALAPYTTLEMLSKLSTADALGRNAHKGIPLPEQIVPRVQEFLERAQQAHVVTQTEKPILYGADLMHIIQPGPEMGAMLAYAYEVQIEEEIKDKEVLLQRVKDRYKL